MNFVLIKYAKIYNMDLQIFSKPSLSERDVSYKSHNTQMILKQEYSYSLLQLNSF